MILNPRSISTESLDREILELCHNGNAASPVDLNRLDALIVESNRRENRKAHAQVSMA